MGRAFLTFSTTVILQAVANGYRYGFDIIDVTGVPGGTVYPALRRLEDAGYLSSQWEEPAVSQAAPRPARKYYELTRPGKAVLTDAVKRYRLPERAQPDRARNPKPSRA